jgi:hypothetical protein
MRVENLLLADAAQESGGKLSMLGAGWSAIYAPGPAPVVHRHLALAGTISIEWNEANEEIPFEIVLENEDGVAVLPEPVSGTVIAGRPPFAPKGQPFTLPLVVPFDDLRFEHFGIYCFRFLSNGEEKKRVSFQVAQLPQ